MVKIHLYPFTAAAIAKPIPVFPEVHSIIVPPGFISPFASASNNIFNAILSLIEFPGLKVSTLIKTLALMPGRIFLICTKGVFPIVSKIDWQYFILFIVFSRYKKFNIYKAKFYGIIFTQQK